MGAMATPILQMEKLRLREVKKCHTLVNGRVDTRIKSLAQRLMHSVPAKC